MIRAEEQDPVTRLYERLAGALAQSRPAGFAAPVTVAEIYQELVPYRAVRDETGFAMNADYEYVLLRLLSGEAGLVRLEPDTAREEIARELRTPNPNVSLYRAYAACDVWVRPAAGVASTGGAPAAPSRQSAPGADPVAGPPPAVRVATSPGVQSRAGASERDPVRPPSQTAHPLRQGGQAPAPGVCVACGTRQPARPRARYCPYCGADQTTRPCGRCGETLEAGWSYCIACGTADARGPQERRS
jgi:hypothetical protein